jgi:hypothetical protein
MWETAKGEMEKLLAALKGKRSPGYFYYIHALTVRASDVRDHVPLNH